MTRKKVLLAKLSRPAAAGLLPRERLFSLLDQARAGTVTWVSGPAGAGKTSLVSSYLENRRIANLWYQVDKGDADIPAFFHYLGVAAKNSGCRKNLPYLTPEYLPALEVFVRRFFQDFFRCSSVPVLVLDNYQEVTADAMFHQIISGALSEIPPGRNVVLISRNEPPAALARWYANSTVVTIEWDQLRLTDDEAVELAGLWGYHGRRDLKVIAHIAQGWAAGLVLLLRANLPEMEMAALGKAAPTAVFDYFAAEILSKTPAANQDFLLKTAFLPSMTAAAAAELTGLREAGKVLSELHRNHFFTTMRSHAEAVFEYHPLFREFLMARAEQEYAAEHLAAVKSGAARLLEQGGQIEAAARLLRDSEEWPELTRLICQHAPAMIAQGRSNTLLAWIAGIAEKFVRQAPWLLYWHGISQLSFNPAQSRSDLEQAHQQFKLQDDVPGALLACVGLMEAYFYEGENFAPIDRWIMEFERLLAHSPALSSPEIEARILAVAWCLLFRDPLHPLLHLWSERALNALRAATDPQQRLTLGKFVFFYYLFRGDLAKIGLIFTEVKPVVDSAQVSPLALLHQRLIETIYGWCTASHETARAALEQALEIGRSTGLHIWLCATYAQGVYLSLSAEDIATAESYLDKMQSLTNPKRRLDVAHYQYVRSGVALSKGDLQNALTYARASVANMEAVGGRFAAAAFRIGLAQILTSGGKHQEARRHFAQALEFARKFNSRILEYQCLLGEAYSLLETAENTAGLAALRRGLAVGREQGYLNFHPWWQPKIMSRLCGCALERDIETAYVRHLISRRGLTAESQDVENWPWPVMVYTLGRFAVVKMGETVRFNHKAQRKPWEMLKALLALGGREVSSGALIEILWPAADGDAAQKSFEITLHRLRKLLGSDQVLTLHDGKLSLQPTMCWVDAWAFERLQSHVQQGIFAPGLGAEKVLNLYHGHFLSGDTDLPWTAARRESLRSRFLRQVAAIGQALESSQRPAAAVNLYQRALELDPLAEPLYRRLMICHQSTGHVAEALNVYRRCREMLSIVLGTRPSVETNAVYLSLKQNA